MYIGAADEPRMNKNPFNSQVAMVPLGPPIVYCTAPFGTRNGPVKSPSDDNMSAQLIANIILLEG